LLAWRGNAVIAFMFASAALAAQPGLCAGAEAVRIPGLEIQSAVEILPGAADLPDDTPPVTAPFCRVQARIDGTIGIELWLPAAAQWNRHLLTGGVGGQGGYFNYRVLGRAVNNGYLGASTDTGHKRDDRHWMLNNPAGVENFVERAHHRLAQTARAFADAFYGSAVSRALFVGCSGAGREGLIEAQRFPADYDGIIVGAPGPKTAEMSARRMWEMVWHRRFGDRMTQAQWDLIAASAVNHCDRDDGVSDGVVADPRRCRFDIASLACKPGQVTGCLTPYQIRSARIIYGPMTDETGKRIDSGLLPTIRVQRTLLPAPGEKGKNVIALAIFGDVIHANPNWDGMTFRIVDDLPLVDRMTRLSPRNPALDDFVARGGKLIMYHGWSDPVVDPRSTIDYYEQVLRSTRPSAHNRDFVRLYMVPGMEHCRGGAGVDQFGGDAADPPRTDPGHDMLTAMERWLDGGPAPATLFATRVESGEVVSERPLCAYPQEAIYDGKGPVNRAASFTCARPGSSDDT